MENRPPACSLADSSAARGLLILWALAVLSQPGLARAETRTWVQASDDSRGLKSCLDPRSVVKRPDGLTSYESEMASSKCNVDNDDGLIQNLVNCDEDMSRETLRLKSHAVVPGAAPRPWPETVTESDLTDIKSNSLAGQTAKFVCKK